MRTFQVFVTDDRYSVPNLMLIQASSQGRARELADAIFRQSAHHRGVELWDDDALLLCVGEARVRPTGLSGAS